ncbi:MAG: protein kinase [Proteobacteria bacterium]|nr:protein kinase [Pseudomonadota bacterium]
MNPHDASRTQILDTGASAVLAGLGAPVDALADLVFGSLTADASVIAGGHLAILPDESLELDLSDPAQRRFGDYELRELIGRGGMGVVYRAYQHSLDREVAVKLLAAGPWASREFIERFRSEAQNAARMQHPNIVAIYEVGSADELHFFSMRLVHGGSLAELLRSEGRLPPLRAAQLLRIVAEAVDYAHRLGVLHLDLKPANVLLDETGTPFVADFGLARRLEHGRAAELNEVSGTPSYMAPEQAIARSQKITPATDIWGLGAILFELVCGQPPFRGGTPESTLKLVAQGRTPDPREFTPSLPADLAAIIGHCMERETGHRYASAHELADDLGRFLDGRPVRVRPLNAMQRVGRWARREPKLAATAALAVLALLAGLVATSIEWRSARGNAATASHNLWNSRNDTITRYMTSGDGWKAAPLLLANIREMESQGDQDRLAGARKRLGILENNNPRLIDVWPVPPLAASIAFSPDGKRIAMSTEQLGIYGYDVASGRETWRLPHGSGGVNDEIWSMEEMQFAPDNRTLIATAWPFTRDSSVPAASFMRRVDTSRGVWLDPPASFADLADASYSPDGRYALLTDSKQRAQFWATDPWRPLGPQGVPPPLTGVWSRLIAPDGSVFAQDSLAHAVVLVDPSTLQIRSRVALEDFGDIAAWAFSPDSRWLALGDRAGALAVVDCRTLQVIRPSPHPILPTRRIAFSADGGWLTVAADGGGVYLWSWPAAKLLTPPFGGAGSQGSWGVVFQAQADPARDTVLVAGNTDTNALWQVAPTEYALDRSDAIQLTANTGARSPVWATSFAWHPGQGLLASVAQNRMRLERLPMPVLRNGRAAPLLPGSLRFDGRHLVEVDGRDLQVVDALSERPIGPRIALPQAPHFAELTADGSTVVATAGPMLFAFDAASGRPRFAPVSLPGTPTNIDPSPDGRRIALTWPQMLDRGDHLNAEVAAIYRLADGARLAGPLALPGMLHGLSFSPDGSRLIAWNHSNLSLRDGTSLQPVAGPLASFRPRRYGEGQSKGYIQTVAFDAAQAVRMIFRHRDGGQAHFELRRYPATGTGYSATPLSLTDVQHILPLPRDGGTAILSNVSSPVLVAPDGASSTLPQSGDDTPIPVEAISADGRWYAYGLRDGVTLFDLHGNVRVVDLRVALPRPDAVARLAFSPDGNHLLARSLMGRLMVWDLTPDARPAAAIERELALRDLAAIGAQGSQEGQAPDAAERAALRAHDPGPPATASIAMPASLRAVPGGGIAPRDAGLTQNQLDLTPWYDFGLRQPLETVLHGGGSDYTWLPQGRQRYLGIDFDLRGGIDLGLPVNARFDLTGASSQTHTPRTISAIDLLITTVNAGDPVKGAASFRLDYADGSQAVLAADFGQRPTGYWRFTAADSALQFVAWGTDVRNLIAHDTGSVAGLLRLPNPHPERPVAAITLIAPGHADVHHSLLAITLEAEPSPAPSRPLHRPQEDSR